MIQNLKLELEPLLLKATKLYVATALINKEGFDFIENLLPSNCKRHYLIGIDLPSDPHVLQKMCELASPGFTVRVYRQTRTYHPKVYIIQTDDERYFSFVGSGNTTGGGLSRNIEMSIKIDDIDQCQNLINWFEDLFSQSFEITFDFIERYKLHYRKIKKRKAGEYSDLKELFPSNSESTTLPQNQFFNSRHYEAYSKQNHDDYSPRANVRRKTSRDRLKQLHERIYPLFNDYNLFRLNCHHNTRNITSLHYFIPGFTSRLLERVWIEYGYTQNGDSLKDHPRLQVILGEEGIGVWLVVGNHNKGSLYERSELKKRLSTSDSFQILLFNYLKELGASYFVYIHGIYKSVNDIKSPSELTDLVLKDDFSQYFIISRTFRPNDPVLSENDIAETVLIEFQRLYPLYDLIRDQKQVI